MESQPTAVNYLQSTLSHAKNGMTKFFDSIDSIDRHMYGKRDKLFIYGALLVLAAPLLDWMFDPIWDRFTYYSTLAFFLFVLVVTLAFMGSWRDDTGTWTWERAKSRLLTYYETFKDGFNATRASSFEENLLMLGQGLFWFGIGWKALQSLSIFIRKPIEKLLHTRLATLRDFEHVTNVWSLIVAGLGIGVLVYLYRKNPFILDRVKNDLKNTLQWNEPAVASVNVEVPHSNIEARLVINAKENDHVQAVATFDKSQLFQDFVLALNQWQPKGAYYEYEFQDRLYRHLKKHIPGVSVQLEYPIGSSSFANRGRADIVINESILIELKRDDSAGAIQRAKGQISQYSDIWKGKGPVVLVLCDFEYDHATLSFTPTMIDLAKLERPVMTIVAKPK